MVAPIARPNWIARSTAPLFNTGSTPGSARSTGLAWVFGSAPKRVAAPLKILDWVESCACVSRPMTTSHCIMSSLFFITAAAGFDIDRQFREIVARPAQGGAARRDVQRVAVACQPDRAIQAVLEIIAAFFACGTGIGQAQAP